MIHSFQSPRGGHRLRAGKYQTNPIFRSCAGTEWLTGGLAKPIRGFSSSRQAETPIVGHGCKHGFTRIRAGPEKYQTNPIFWASHWGPKGLRAIQRSRFRSLWLYCNARGCRLRDRKPANPTGGWENKVSFSVTQLHRPCGSVTRTDEKALRATAIHFFLRWGADQRSH